MITALLDGDIIVYRAAAAATDDIDWGDGISSPIANVQSAKDMADELVTKWTRGCGASRAIVLLTDPKANFRREIWPDYKSGRGEKPEAYWPTRAHIVDKYETYEEPRLEADDLLGLMSTNPKSMGQFTIVSIDKDLQTVPGRLFNPMKDSRVRHISMARADWYWMYQTLIGDPTDGFKGAKGIGPKKAEQILGPHKGNLSAMWHAVVEGFESRGQTEDDALLNARMARMLRHGEYDWTTKEITVWHPTCRLRLPLKTSSDGRTTTNPPSTLSTPQRTTPASPSSLSTSSSPTSLGSRKARSSSTSAGGPSKTASKTSRRLGTSSTSSLPTRKGRRSRKKSSVRS